MDKKKDKILIVDDESEVCNLLRCLMEREGFEGLVADCGRRALRMIHSHLPDALLLDIRMPEMDGMEVLRKTRALDPGLPVIMITGDADIPGAVHAMRSGAHDYIPKPFDHAEVVRIVRRALRERELNQRVKTLTQQLGDSLSLSKMMGPSEAVAFLVSQVNQVAKTDFAVVIQGETGSGKELVARAIHHSSHRFNAPFVPVDCGAIPETLLESELFGHEKGAFTGATHLKPGKFEAAGDGTLFLDEIANLPMSSQAKLLRALQGKILYRVGGTKPVPVEGRMLVATNQDLSEAVSSGTFRDDLFYRLNEFSLRIPPLRERREDIPYLARRFLEMTNLELGKRVTELSEAAMEALIAYDWPGNVRQLRSAIRRAVLLADEIVSDRHLELQSGSLSNGEKPPAKLHGKSWGAFSLREIVQDSTRAVERHVLSQAMRRTGGNKAKAARLLQIDYKTIHTKLKQLGISTNGGENGQ